MVTTGAPFGLTERALQMRQLQEVVFSGYFCRGGASAKSVGLWRCEIGLLLRDILIAILGARTADMSAHVRARFSSGRRPRSVRT
jgi:hypothetical protein